MAGLALLRFPITTWPDFSVPDGLYAAPASLPGTVSACQDNPWVLGTAIVMCWALPVVPVLAYLCVDWRAKCLDITDSITTEAKGYYLKTFAPSTLHDSKPGCVDVDMIFKKFYTRWYGRRQYWPPLLLFMAVLAFLLTHVAFSTASLFPYWLEHQPEFRYALDKLALMAIAGAYLWVSSDFITRARRLDFAPSDIHWGTLRLVIAVPMGHAFAGLPSLNVAGGQVTASVIAFALGAFPLGSLVEILRAIVDKTWIRKVPLKERTDAVIKLQGVDDEIAIRMQNEGITTIPQVAYCDPIRLVMRANLTFNFVIDCMNQSLAWVYFEKQMAHLRPLGLRGAVEISFLMHSLKSTDPMVLKQAESTLDDMVLAIRPPHTAFTLRYTLAQIADDPYTHFLNLVWADPLGQRDI